MKNSDFLPDFLKSFEKDGIHALGCLNQHEFRKKSLELRLAKGYIGDTFKDNLTDSTAINIVRISNGNSKKTIGFYTIPPKCENGTLEYVNTLYQCLMLGSRKGLPEPLKEITRKFEARLGPESDKKKIRELYKAKFENLRTDISTMKSDISYHVFATAIELAFGKEIDSKILDKLSKIKIAPISDINSYSLRFFSDLLR